MKVYSKQEMEGILHACKGKDFMACRAIVAQAGITFKSLIAKEAFFVAYDVRVMVANPADLGSAGKLSENLENLQRWDENEHVHALPWRSFFARQPRYADIKADGISYEKKTGAGDWLHSRRNDTWQDIIDEFRAKDSWIIWETDEFRIEAPWGDFMDYLEAYKPSKGLATWFRPEVKLSSYGSCIMMQSFKNSKPKMAYLMACPMNVWGEG